MADTPAAAGVRNPGFAPAKVNLTLHVTGRRADGLHTLDSLVAFADLGDCVRATPAEVAALTVTGPMAEGVPGDDRNLILRAARWMGATAAFHLDKHLPAAAGIGGGSSDAAAALRLLAGMTGRPIPDGSEALGADVPVCLLACAARMRGIGELVEPVDLPPLPAVLVNPRFEVPTGAVFGGLRRASNPPMPDRLPAFPDAVSAARWLAEQRNDLEAPAMAHAPVIGAVLTSLRGLPGVLLARMSGSGATCFGLFESMAAAQDAAGRVAREQPGWWTRPTLLS